MTAGSRPGIAPTPARGIGPNASNFPLSIGVDGRVFEPPRTGVGRYVYEIARALDATLPPDTRFFVYARRPVPLPGASPRWTLRNEPNATFQRLPASVWLLTRAGALARRDPLSVFWATSALGPLGLGDVPTVATVYDVANLVARDTMPQGLRYIHALRFGPDLRRAASVVAVSRGTAARVLDAYGVRCAAVANPAVSAAFAPPTPDAVARVRTRYHLDAPYFLTVATREPRKNLPLLLASFAAARARGTIGAHRLALAGAAGWGRAGTAHEAGVDDAVDVLGYVPDDDLPALYAGATAFVLPSRYEGFGMPVLEARACGAAVITTDLPELREAGGPEVCYLPPGDLGRALETALGDVAMGRVIRADGAAARAWTWDDAARVYAEQLRAVARPSRRSMSG